MEEERRDALVVRLFPGWAQSPVWIPGGPVDPGESLLTRELVEDLLMWENSYYATPQGPRDSEDAGAGDVGTGPSPQERQHLADGKTLAERLGAELGHSFAVSFEPGVQEHYLARSGGPATNPAAARVFAHWFAEEEGMQKRLRTSGGLHAYAPLSGETLSAAPPRPDNP